MTARNSILLIVKQSPGIEFNSLLSKISGNYGSINSARAALSRAVKDLNARGLIAKTGKRVFPTEKGMTVLGKEMKSKLIIKLNQNLKSKNPAENIDEIIQLLSTLINRSREDSDLLKAARGSTSFFISDLNKLKEEAKTKSKHIEYLSTVLENQILSLAEMNFPETIQMQWNAVTKQIAENAVNNIEGADFTAECLNKEFSETIQAKIVAKKTEGNHSTMEKTKINALMEEAEKISLQYNPINIFAGTIKIQLSYPSIFFIGPAKDLESLKQKNAAVV